MLLSVFALVFCLPAVSYAANVSQTASAVNSFTGKEDAVVKIGTLFEDAYQWPEPKYNRVEGKFEPKEGGETMEIFVSGGFTGTGFIVSKDGYILTNAHVVDTSINAENEALWPMIIDEVDRQLQDVYAQDGLSKEEFQEIEDKFFSYIIDNGSWRGDGTILIGVMKRDYEASSFSDAVQNGYRVDVKKFGQPFPNVGKDVAVLKIDTDMSLTAMLLGSMEDVNLGDQVYVLGYPMAADLKYSDMTPTITSGVVGAFKKTEQGDYNVIQIDAVVSPGNSGGPVLDAKGRVVGIATFGSIQSESFNWILPIELGKESLDELNIRYSSGGVFLRIETFARNMLGWIFGIVIFVGIMFFLVRHQRRLDIHMTDPSQDDNGPSGLSQNVLVSHAEKMRRINIEKMILMAVIGLVAGLFVAMGITLISPESLPGIISGTVFYFVWAGTALVFGYFGSRMRTDTQIHADMKSSVTGNDELTRSEKIWAWIACLINPVISGAIMYYMWRRYFPNKAKQANQISFMAVFIWAILFIVIGYMPA